MLTILEQCFFTVPLIKSLTVIFFKRLSLLVKTGMETLKPEITVRFYKVYEEQPRKNEF